MPQAINSTSAAAGQDVDLENGFLMVRAGYAKNGEMRAVQLNSIAKGAILKAMELVESDYVFARGDGKPYKSIRSAFETACRNATLTDVSPHVLRHTFASRLAMANVDASTLQMLGGWKDLKMVQRYVQISSEHRAAAVERIAVGVAPSLFTSPLPERKKRARKSLNLQIVGR